MTRRPPDDPLSRLDREAHRLKAEEDAGKMVSAARARLVLGKSAAYCFFATLALRLKVRMDWDIDTAATDGKHLHVNPDWFHQLGLEQAKGVVAHEVMHNAMMHHTRRGARNPSRWNIACDLAVNPIILDSGLQLPPGRLMPGQGKYAHLKPGLSAEEYYAQLQDPPQKCPALQGGQGDGDGQPQDPGGCGGVMPPGDGSPAALRQAESEGEVATAQARQVAKQRGNLPASIDKLVADLLAPKVDWKNVLREFVNAHARNDYSWSPPNKRYVHMGLYLPGLRSEELGELVVTLDESGSISDENLREFGSELQGILDQFDCKLTILHHDTEVQHVEEWNRNDGPLVLRRRCSGGTSHVPVFDWIDRNVERPTCVLCLTDLYTDFPPAPAYPTLWCVTEGSPDHVPFGQRLEIK